MCLIGTSAYGQAQWDALREEVKALRGRFAIERFWSHNQITVGKTCPGFSVREWIAGGMVPLNGHIFKSGRA